MMNVLVAGGAGYIGSHMLKSLAAEGHEVTTLDNLSKGYRDAVKYGEFVRGDLADCDQLQQIFGANRFDAVMHFASFIEVAESMTEPEKYFRNNVDNTRNLLEAMVESGVRHIIFSSSAAIFGEPHYTPIDETHPTQPINPYGESKLQVEQMLDEFDRTHGLRSVSLRYFNAAGADMDGQLGERHDPETHLIPLVLQAASGRREAISVYGSDYDTYDGSCVRDYIHVQDLCEAHLLALQYLHNADTSEQFNLGNGQGYSVRQVIDCVREITGNNFSVVEESRRAGDPAVLVADPTRAMKRLGWTPKHSSLENIVATAWNWERSFFLQ